MSNHADNPIEEQLIAATVDEHSREARSARSPDADSQEEHSAVEDPRDQEQRSPTAANVADAGLAARIALSVCAVVLLAMIVTLLWGIDRGIEFRDDGLALLCMANPDLYAQPEAFGYYLRLCPHLVPNDIINLRVLHVITSLVGASVLALGFARWLTTQCKSIEFNGVLTAGLWFVSAIGSLTAFAVLSPALSYNGLTALFIFSAAGLLFYALSFSEPRDSVLAKYALVACGALTALGFFAKFCAALLFLAIAVSIVLIARPRHARAVVSWFSLGAISGTLFFFGLVQAPQSWWQSFAEAIKLEISGAHGPGVVFGATVKSLQKHWIETFVAIALIAVVQLLAIVLEPADHPVLKKALIWSLMMATTIGFTVLSFLKIGYAHTLLLYVPMLTIFFAASLYVIETGPFACLKQENCKPLYIVISLMLLSLATAAGSNNVLGWQMINYFAPFTMFYWIAFLAIARYLRSPMFFAVASACLFATFFAVLFQGYVIAPHGTDSLFEQTETAHTPARIAGLRLSPGDLNFVQETDKILRQSGFHSGDRLMALFDLPMLVYAVGAVSPGGAWYYSDVRDMPKNERYMESASHEAGPLYLIIYVIKIKSPNVSELLNRHGFDLERDFRQIGTTQRQHWRGTARIYKYWGNSSEHSK